MGRRKKVLALSILILVLSLTLVFPRGGLLRNVSAISDVTYENLRIFADALSLIQDNYIEKVEPKKLIYGALKGMVGTLDPFSGFMEPEEHKVMEEERRGGFTGIGIEIGLRDGLLTVVSPIEGTPAFRAGLKAGDRIMKIDGQETKNMSLNEAVKRIRGPKGTKVTLTILREGEKEPLEFTIIRDFVPLVTLRSKVIEGDIGYVKLSSFMDQKTGKKLEEALAKLEKEVIKGLILDLRNNPGGLIEMAVEVASEFIPEGKLIVYTEGRRKGQSVKFHARKPSAPHEYPLVVLINLGSASASEIVAGAIQDWERGTIVGTHTFGKASVQQIYTLSDRSALRLTVAQYFTPKGRGIHGKGITPDVVVEEPKLTKEEQEIIRKLEEEKYVRNFLQSHPKYTDQEVDSFLLELRERGITISKDLLLRVLRAQDADEANDILNDPQLLKAVELLRAKIGRPQA